MMKAKKRANGFLVKALLIVCFIFVISGPLSAQNELVVHAAKANVHLSPDSDSQVMDILSKGSVLSLFEAGQKQREWFYVSYFSKAHNAYATGFIHASQVELVIDSEDGIPYPSKPDESNESRSISLESSGEAEREPESKSESEVVRKNSVKIGAVYFTPSESAFKDIYGSGLGFGGELNFGLWKSVSVWVIGNYYSSEGMLPVTNETTMLSLVALGGGPKFRLSQARVSPYLGIGPVVYFFKEENPIGLAEGNGIGFIGQFGCSVQVAGGLILDVSVNYTYCNVQPQDIKANVGGVQLGLSIGYSF